MRATARDDTGVPFAAGVRQGHREHRAASAQPSRTAGAGAGHRVSCQRRAVQRRGRVRAGAGFRSRFRAAAGGHGRVGAAAHRCHRVRRRPVRGRRRAHHRRRHPSRVRGGRGRRLDGGVPEPARHAAAGAAGARLQRHGRPARRAGVVAAGAASRGACRGGPDGRSAAVRGNAAGRRRGCVRAPDRRTATAGGRLPAGAGRPACRADLERPAALHPRRTALSRVRAQVPERVRRRRAWRDRHGPSAVGRRTGRTGDRGIAPCVRPRSVQN